jgi:siroheme synthase
MNKSSLIAALLVATAFAAAPAIAKTSVVKGLQICVAAVKQQDPAPKSARVDRDATRSNDETLTVRLKVKNADDTSAMLVCTVDRATGSPSLAPES